MAREELIVGIGADTAGLQREIRVAAGFVEELSNQFADLIPNVDTSAFLDEVVAGVREAGAELGTTAEQARVVEQLLAELGQGGAGGASGLDDLAASSRAAAAQQATLAAEAQQTTAAISDLNAAVARTPPPPDPPDFSEWIVAADLVRSEFDNVISVNEIGQRAATAARTGADALQAGFLGRLGELRDLLSAGLISPRDFAKQADVAMEAFSREIAARQSRIPRIVIRARVATEAPNMISDAELQEAEKAFERITGETTNATRASQGYGRQTERTNAEIRQGARAANIARNALTGLAAQSLGTSSAMGQLAQSVFLFAGGVGKIAAVAGVVLVVAKAFEYLTTQSRELREAEEQRTKALAQQADQALPAAVRANQGLTAALNEQARAREKLIQSEFERGATGGGLGVILAPLFTENQRRQAEQIRSAEQAERQARENIIAGIREQQDVNVRALTESIQLGIADNSQRKQAIGFLQILRDRITDNTLTEQQQAEAKRLLLGLEESLLQVTTQRVDAIREASEAEARDTAIRIQAIQLGTQDLEARQQMVGIAADLLRRAKDETLTLEERNRAQEQYNQLLQVQLARQTDPIQQQLSTIRSLQSLQKTLGLGVTLPLDVSEALANLDTAEAKLLKLLKTANAQQKPVILQLLAEVSTTQLGAERDKVQAELERLNVAIKVFAELDPVLRDVRRQFGVPIPVGLDTEAAMADAEALRAEIARRISAAVQGGERSEVVAELVSAFDLLTAQINTATEAPVRALIEGASQASEHLAAVEGALEAARRLAAGPLDAGASIEEVAARTAILAPLVDDVRSRYEQVTAAIQAGGHSVEVVNALLREQVDLLDQLTAARGPSPLAATQLGPLQAAADDFAAAKRTLDLALQSQDQGAIADAKRELDARAQIMDKVAESIAKVTVKLGLNAEDTKEIVDGIAEAYEKAGREASDLVQHAKRLSNAMTDVADSVAAFRSIAANLGLIGEEGARALDVMEGLAEAAARFASGDILGGILGGLQSIAGLAVGEPAREERNQIIEENNERLSELTDALNEQLQGAQGLDLAREAARALAGNMDLLRRAQLPDNLTTRGLRSAAIEELQAELERLGISLAELDRIAEANGIQLLDSKGRIVAAAFEQLIPVLDQAILDITTFGDSIADQRSILETERALFGTGLEGGAGQLEIDRELLLGNLNLGDALEAEIAALDLGSEEGQQAFREFLKSLFQQGKEGFGEGILEGEITADDILGIIGDSATALDELGESAREATQEMLNVPTGFKLAAARFAADAGEVGIREFTGPMVPVMAGEGASQGFQEALESLKGTQFNAPITIEIDGRGKDTQQLARDVVKELRNLSQARFGTTDRWGEL